MTHGKLLVHLPDPSGWLGLPASFGVGYRGSVAINDVDGDGRLDGVVRNLASIGVLLHDASGDLRPESSIRSRSTRAGRMS